MLEPIKNTMKRLFVIIDVNTDKNANTNLNLHNPPSGPSVDSTAQGPFWRKLVIPRAPLIIEVIYETKNKVDPPGPLNTAHLLF